MWAQTYKNGNRYYREQKGSRGDGYCVNRSRSMPCQVPDQQISRIIEAILLPETWMDRMLATIQAVDEVKRVNRERKEAEQALKRLGQVYLDGLVEPEEYRRQKRTLEEKLHTLVVPGVDTVQQAGKLLEDLPTLWGRADLGERRKILLTMLVLSQLGFGNCLRKRLRLLPFLRSVDAGRWQRWDENGMWFG